MTVRHFIYGLLTDESITQHVGGDNPRIYAKKTMTSAQEQHPFLVYKMGNETSEDFAETEDISNQFLQVWIHDYHDQDNADYDKIDEIASAIRKKFRSATGGAHGAWFIEYLETSQDLNDDTLNTVFRYLRFQVKKKE